MLRNSAQFSRRAAAASSSLQVPTANSGCSNECFAELDEGLAPWQVGLITAVFMTVGIVFGLLLIKGNAGAGAGQRSDAEGNFDGMEMSARTVGGGNPMARPPPAPPRKSTS